jgi:hypothetical protein
LKKIDHSNNTYSSKSISSTNRNQLNNAPNSSKNESSSKSNSSSTNQYQFQSGNQQQNEKKISNETYLLNGSIHEDVRLNLTGVEPTNILRQHHQNQSNGRQNHQHQQNRQTPYFQNLYWNQPHQIHQNQYGNQQQHNHQNRFDNPLQNGKEMQIGNQQHHGLVNETISSKSINSPANQLFNSKDMCKKQSEDEDEDFNQTKTYLLNGSIHEDVRLNLTGVEPTNILRQHQQNQSNGRQNHQHQQNRQTPYFQNLYGNHQHQIHQNQYGNQQQRGQEMQYGNQQQHNHQFQNNNRDQQQMLRNLSQNYQLANMFRNVSLQTVNKFI